MRVIIQGYIFEGPWSLGTEFNNVSGIYIIYTQSNQILDIGQTDSLGTRLLKHERKAEWILKAGLEKIFVAFHKENNEIQRLFKERLLRLSLNPLCGEK